MSTRMTTWLRERIAKDVLEHRFSEAAATLVSKRAALAGDVYNDVYTASDRRKMDALPSGWLPEDNDIGVQFDGARGYTQLRFNGAIYGSVATVLKVTLKPVNRRMRANDIRGCVKVYEATHPFTERWNALEGEASDLAKQIEAADRQLKSALASASTIKRLIDMWPEIEPFALKHESEKAPLPALPTKDLNALLDLPVSEAA